MNERALLAILAAIIWSSQREQLREEAEEDDGPDDGAIAEAVSYASDILVEVDQSLNPGGEKDRRVVDAEIVEDEPVRRRR